MAEETMNAATPGPWIAGSGIADGGYLGVWKKDTDHVICRVSPIKTINMNDFHNACLIASAPDLLVALKAIIHEADMHPFNPIGHVIEYVVTTARAAIEKAEFKG